MTQGLPTIQCPWDLIPLACPASPDSPILLSTAPDEAPTILSVTPHTTTSVLIRWQVRVSGRGGHRCGHRADMSTDLRAQGWGEGTASSTFALHVANPGPILGIP